MDFDDSWISNLASQFISSQSFDFLSFDEAKEKISYRTDLYEKYIVYDRFSLYIYEQNFSHDEYRLFCKECDRLYKPPNNEHEKRRVEYGILFQYFKCKRELYDYSIAKTERPDFVLKKDDFSIGVEVTQLTTQYEKIMDKIASMSGKGIPVNELKTNAVSRHGLKANDYQYQDINGASVVETETLRPDNIRKMFVQKILNKYLLYESKIKDFNEFIILCDAQHGITITNKWEVDDIHNMLLEHSFNKPFRLAILWYDLKLYCAEYQVMKSYRKKI